MNRVQAQRKQGNLGRWAINNPAANLKSNEDLANSVEECSNLLKDQVSQMIDKVLGQRSS
jgi:hypothetical protein